MKTKILGLIFALVAIDCFGDVRAFTLNDKTDSIKAELLKITVVGQSVDVVSAKIRDNIKVMRPFKYDKNNGAFVLGSDGRGYTKQIGVRSITAYLDIQKRFPYGADFLICRWAFDKNDVLLGLYIIRLSE